MIYAYYWQIIFANATLNHINNIACDIIMILFIIYAWFKNLATVASSYASIMI